jgi:phage terminase Nu1 subunit (DNA packaging protein)
MELCSALQISPRSFARLVEAGLPVRERGNRGHASRYDLDEVRAWQAKRAEAETAGTELNWSHERARKERAQAVLAEQLAASRAGQLLPAADVERAIASRVSAARAVALAWESSLGDRLGLDAGQRTLLGAEVRRFLLELAGGDAEAVPHAKRRKGEAA